MLNVDFDSNRYEKRLKGTLSWLSDVAPWMNLIVPMGIVLVIGYFHFYHIYDVIGKEITPGAGAVIGGFIWLLIASIRITLLFATVYDFRQQDYIEGTLGFLASIGVLAFDLWFIGQICEVQFPSHAATIATVLRFLSVLAVALEARLVLMLWDSSARRAARKAKKAPSNGTFRSQSQTETTSGKNLFQSP